MTEFTQFGEHLGDFLRGLLRVPAKDSGSEIQPLSKKYIAVDCTETSMGTTVSLDMELDRTEWPLTVDVTFMGVVQFSTGKTFDIRQIIAKDYANALSLQPVPQRPDTWHIVADGDIQPLFQQPYEVKLTERTIPGTSVVRLTGQVFDPNTQKRVNFAVTHDPVETVVLTIVAGFAALICGGVVLIETATDHCTNQGTLQCGQRGVRRITLQRKYGFSWKKGGTEIGCGEECKIECNP